MRVPFDDKAGLIILNTEIIGPSSRAYVRLAFDTGATRTLINKGILVALGYEPSLSPDRQQVTTGSGVESVPVIQLNRIGCLGIIKRNFRVLCHTLPPSAGVDGLLGMDFLVNKKIIIDLRNRILTIESCKKEKR
jgi:aspartyl protease family protein